MGKKTKVGKQRKDKFYQLAKETGFRSRAAFKLIQLNRKFEFLQRSQVLIDLCAAPGGWMQVAKQNMPVNSVVVGVDLHPIKFVPGCISIIGDITIDKCRSDLSKELQNWKVDTVLHDGAPNVGQNWIHDAYQQACLTLSALKLATHFLKQGGWFVTKVFRSKDYNPLLWVLKQLFKKVHATKPQASRNESAEIFVVCQYYIAPAKLDGRFLDPRYVFKELDMEPDNKLNLLHPDKQKKFKAEGYSDLRGVYHSVTATEFISSEDPLSVLQVASCVKLDNSEVANHPTTTPEIVECCKDIKVLGRKDLRALLLWAKTLKKTILKPDEKEDVKTENIDEEDEAPLDKDEQEMELDKMEEIINELEDEEARTLKRKKKRVNRERAKLQEKLNLKMIHKGDDGPTEEDTQEPLFTLTQIKTKQALLNVDNQKPDMLVDSDQHDSDEESDKGYKSSYQAYAKGRGRLDDSGKGYVDSSEEGEVEVDSTNLKKYIRDVSSASDSDSSDNDSGMEEGIVDNKEKKKVRFKVGSDGDEEDDNDFDLKTDDEEVDDEGEKIDPDSNPLLTDLDTRDSETKKLQKAQLWFQKDAFKDLEKEEDEAFELEQMAESVAQKGGRVIGKHERKVAKEKGAIKKQRDSPMSPDESQGSVSESDETDSEYNFDSLAEKRNLKRKFGSDERKTSQEKRKKVKLNERELALGSMMVTSEKVKRDLIDEGWNRYTFNDDNLPDWFVEEEKKHMKKEAPVPQELVSEYQKNFNEFNSRPIKKVIEARARKKKRMQRRLEKAKKKLEGMMDNPDVSEKEKARQIQKLYRKEPKKEMTYIVAKKHSAAKRMRRPPGVKGKFKVVDPRMKKDLRAVRAKESKSKSKGHKRRR